MISKNEIQQLSDEELTMVLTDVLLQTLSDKRFESFIKKFAGLNNGRSIHIWRGGLNE